MILFLGAGCSPSTVANVDVRASALRPVALLGDALPIATPDVTVDQGVSRVYVASLSADFVAKAGDASALPHILFQPPGSDIVCNAERTHSARHRWFVDAPRLGKTSEAVTWMGQCENGSVLRLVIVGSRVFGTLEWSSGDVSDQARVLTIHTTQNDAAVVMQEYDSHAYHTRGGLRTRNDVAGSAQAESSQAAGPAGSVTPAAGLDGSNGVADVLLLYTQSTVDELGGDESALQATLLAEAEAVNEAMRNSRISLHVRVVSMRKVDYAELGNNEDLHRLHDKGDGYLDYVHEWRDEVGADFVHLVVRTYDACGQAYVSVQFGRANPNDVFGVSKLACLDGINFAHELGHNMGMAHDHQNPYTPPIDTYWAYEYSFGYDAGKYITVMAIPGPGDIREDQWIRYYSNPNVQYQGNTLGVPYTCSAPGDPACGNAADAARSMHEAARLFTNFRQYVCADDSSCIDPEFPYCSPNRNCGECQTDAQCADSAAGCVCDPQRFMCVACNQSSDCTADPSRPLCDVSKHECVACLANEDCATQAGATCCAGQCAASCVFIPVVQSQ